MKALETLKRVRNQLKLCDIAEVEDLAIIAAERFPTLADVIDGKAAAKLDDVVIAMTDLRQAVVLFAQLFDRFDDVSHEILSDLGADRKNITTWRETSDGERIIEIMRRHGVEL